MRCLLLLFALLATVFALRLKIQDRLAFPYLNGMIRPSISDDDYDRYLSELGSQLFKRSSDYNQFMRSKD
ncbi:hypothetical protein RB195_013788 [Necator americanus]|uniref:Uncharacterized protein n=1 Tax=Necator americanus TaxID=51031 RepID=A0ABR1DXK8_NECAM